MNKTEIEQKYKVRSRSTVEVEHLEQVMALNIIVWSLKLTYFVNFAYKNVLTSLEKI